MRHHHQQGLALKATNGGNGGGPSRRDKHRAMDASLDWYRNAGIPIKFSRTPGSIRGTPPKFGEHGREILAENGFARDEIEALAKDGVLVEKRRR